jgi:hypothetical protein
LFQRTIEIKFSPNDQGTVILDASYQLLIVLLPEVPALNVIDEIGKLRLLFMG